MEKPPRHRLNDVERGALLVEQAALIERLAAWITELEVLVGKPRKTSANFHTPLSQDGPGRPGKAVSIRIGKRRPGFRARTGR